MPIEASQASAEGGLMPMIGTWMLRRRCVSFGSMANDETITASALRRTGSVEKKLRRSCGVSIW